MHARRKLKTKSGIAPLLDQPEDKESMKFHSAEKADILLLQFSSIFTHKTDREIPRIESRISASMSTLAIMVQMIIEDLSRNLNQYKSCGPDKLHPCLLNELALLIRYSTMLH